MPLDPNDLAANEVMLRLSFAHRVSAGVAMSVLSAYDAVQLAAALEVRQQRSKIGFGPMTLISADHALNDATTAEGLNVGDPNLHP
jgi:hypothetical protein